MPLTAGSHVGVYEIVSLLGSGGMGEVYRARDTVLKRQVAVKVLPPEVASDPDRVARFQREAEVLASLNHPNIAHLYGVEKSNGTLALAMELVEGRTLADRIVDGPVPLDEAIVIAKQIAEALEAAHEQGIIHRDLKPANIKVREDRTVKVLDFGLAKAMEPTASGARASDLTKSPTLTSPALMALDWRSRPPEQGRGLTGAGVLVGTPAYMSPEQARGEPLDRRTDIWAFGCVLYEMLAGRSPFAAKTFSDILAGILDREVDWTALPAATPAHIRHLLRRCLAKDRRKRLRDIADAELDGTEAPAVGSPQSPRRGTVRIVLVVGAAIAAGAIGGARLRPNTSQPSAAAVIERLTFDPGLATSPALSSDGRLLAFASNRSGREDLDIWVEQVGGSPLRVTDDAADDTEPDFSPDAHDIAFRSERAAGGIYIVPALGGPARLVVEEGRRPHYSPDGTRLVYWTGQFRGNPLGTASSIFVVPLSGGQPVRLADNFRVARDPVWAPDGRSILFLGRRDEQASGQNFDWWWAPLDGQSPAKTGILEILDWRTAAVQERMSIGPWLESGVIFTVGSSVWLLPVSPANGRIAGAPRPLAAGAGSYRFATASRDGQVVFSDTLVHRVIERASLEHLDDPPLALYTDGAPFTARASQTTDGRVIAFERVSGAGYEIRHKDLTTGVERTIATTVSDQQVNPTIAPNGSRISYVVRNAAGFDRGQTYVVETAGGIPKMICDTCGLSHFLDDSRRLVIVPAGATDVRVVDVESMVAYDVLHAPSGGLSRPTVSPNERWLAFRRAEGVTGKTFVTRFVGHSESPPPPEAWSPIDEPTTTGRPAGWSPDSRVLYLLLDVDGYRCLWAQRVDESGRLLGKPYPARHFHDERGNTMGTTLGNAISPLGFLYERATVTGSLWRLTPPSEARSASR